MKDLKFIGQTKGSPIEESIKNGFKSEAVGAATYTAIAFIARNKGFNDVAESLEKIALDEIKHAAMYAILNGMVSEDNIMEQLKKFSMIEAAADEKLGKLAQAAEKLGFKESEQMILESIEDENKHSKILKDLYEENMQK